MVTNLLRKPYVIMSMVWSRCARYYLPLFLLWTTLPSAVWSETQQYEGRRIVKIEYSPPEQPVVAVELEQLIPLKPGALLRMSEVRQSIEKL